MKKFLPFILIALALPIVATLGYLFTQEPPEQEFSFRVIGSSMLPTMQLGDVAFAKRIPYGDLQAGMIVTTTEGIVHRITGKDRFGWVIAGDNNPISDKHLMTRKDYEATVLYWMSASGVMRVPEYATPYLDPE